ncbi:hypothetical protein RJ640_029895 [Escallonia rubra]|uniref:Uncharacterized protein n=1 Tax=Escallonia rubra TaxID=112253 RepID=A0AA88QMJ4_9ASTE|nr:hypothetical protein RJ640_029895 [Escallonia rubra]
MATKAVLLLLAYMLFLTTEVTSITEETDPEHAKSSLKAPVHAPSKAPTHPPERPHVHAPAKAPCHAPEKSHVYPPKKAPVHAPEHSHVYPPSKAPAHHPAEKKHHHQHHHHHAPEKAPAHPPVKAVAPPPHPVASKHGCVPMCEEYCKKNHKKVPCVKPCTACCAESKCVPGAKKCSKWDQVSSKDEELFMQTAYAVPAVAPAHSPLKAPAPPLLVKPPVPAPLVNPPPSAPLPPPKTIKDCYPLCAVRCKLHSRKNLCLRVCVTCCVRCKCVPPGQYGNYDKGNHCYANMTTRGGRRKCP